MILVEFDADRRNVGRLSLLSQSGKLILGPFPALGLADQSAAAAHSNPERLPTKPFGDTPTGVYNCHIEPPQTPEHSYGPNKVILLQPVSGDALLAANNGRSGLLIHGGDPALGNRLRPTHGCIRLFNDDIKTLVEWLSSASESATICVVKAPLDGGASLAEPHPVQSSIPPDSLNSAFYPETELPASSIDKPGIVE